jgi:outer membrane protein
MKLRMFTLAVFTLTATQAFADESSQWGLGVGAVISDNPYAGRGTRYTPLPLITYESDRLFFRGITGGVHLLNHEGMKINAIVEARLDGIDAKDFGRQELAAHGVNRDLLDDRDDSADAGFTLGFEGRYGEVDVKLLADILDVSGGYEASLQYGYPFKISDRLALTPKVGVTWLSDDLAQYYYGTSDKEMARGVVSYKPDAAAIPEIGIGLSYRFAGRWMLLGNLSYKSLPNEIGNSPLLESDRAASLLIGVLRAF